MLKKLRVGLFSLMVVLSLGGVATQAQAAPSQSNNPPALPSDFKPGAEKKPTKKEKAEKGLPPSAGPQTRVASCASTPPACYSYVSRYQQTTSPASRGVMTTASIENPAIHPLDSHTLWETSVQNTVGNQIVEIGFIKDPTLCPVSTTVCLFTYYWVNGHPTCYNVCGFTPDVNATIQPGDSLGSAVGTTKTFGIIHYTNGTDCTCTSGWYPYYDGQYLGYYADTNWTGATPPASFSNSDLYQVFGEVAAQYNPTETDMGSGKIANSTQGATAGVSNVYSTTATAITPNLVAPSLTPNPYLTAPDRWSRYDISTTSFRYGGPGGHTDMPFTTGGAVCQGVGSPFGTAQPAAAGTVNVPGGYGEFCGAQNVDVSGVPTIQKWRIDGNVPRNTCFSGFGTSGASPAGSKDVRALVNSTYVQWRIWDTNNCTGNSLYLDYGTTVLPVAFKLLPNMSIARTSNAVSCATTSPNTCN